MVALSPVSPSLAPATNYDRINAAITEAAKVSNKQDAFDLAALLTSVSQRVLQTDFAALVTTVNSKASATALTALQTTVATKANQSTVTALTTTVNSKASQADLNALTTTVGTKASAASVTALTTTVETKASQSTVDTLTNSVASLSQAVSGKAAQSDLASLTQVVNGKATQSAFDTLSTVVSGKVAQTAFDNLVVTVSGKASQSALNDLRDLLFRINAGVYPSERPGDNPTAFTASRAGGDPGALAPLDTTLYPIRAVADGLGVEVSGSREVWERTLHAVEPGRLWRARWRYVRTTNAQDPENDSVQALIQWYDSNRAAFGSPVQVEAFTPSVAGGPHERLDFIGLAGVTGVTIARPNGAVYFRLGCKAFGVEARTVLTDLHAADVSDIEDAIRRLVPDDALPNLSARIDGLVEDLAQESADRQAVDTAIDGRVDGLNERVALADQTLFGLAKDVETRVQFDLLTDRFIDEVYYKWVIVSQDHDVLFGFDVEGRLIVPGRFDVSNDGIFAAELGFGRGNGALSNYLVPRADGRRTYVRGWEQALGLPVLSHFPMVSQSNGFGADGNRVLSPNDLELGVLAPRRGWRTWSDAILVAPNAVNRGRAAFVLDRWVDRAIVANGDTHATAFASQFKAAQVGGRFAAANLAEMAPYIVFTNANRGERFLRDIGPDGTYGHFAAWTDDVAKLAGEALRNGWTYGIPGILFMQGEAETRGQLDPGGPFLSFSALVAGYSGRLSSYRQRYETAAKDAAASVGMSLPNRPIPWFIVQTAYVWSGEAQRRSALSDQAIFGVATMYQGPSGLNGEHDYIDENSGVRIQTRGATVHNDCDTTRWLGELAGKNVRRILLEGLDVRPLEMTDAVRLSPTEVMVKFHVPFPPLQVETTFLPNVANRGFQVRLGTPDVPGGYLTVASCEVLAEAVILTLDPATPLAAGQAAHIVIGEVVDVRTTATTVQSVSTTGTRASGQPAVQLVFAGDQRAQFADLIIQGAFQANQPGIGKGMSVFEVSYDAGANTTTLVGEQRNYTGPMQAGLPLALQRDRAWCNLHDSDPAVSHYGFQAPYSGMFGQPYPMWNWAWFGVQTVRT